MSKRRRAKAGAAHIDDPRDALFAKFYVEGRQPDFGPGNAYQSCIAAGFSRATAKSNCHLIAARNRTEIGRAFRLLRADEFYLARKIIALTQAKTVKWNPAKRGTKDKPKGGWDTFDDGTTQLGAAKELGRFLDAYPAPKEEGTESRPIEFIFPANFAGLMQPEQEKAGG